jgi:CDP-paratose 2-epimerase
VDWNTELLRRTLPRYRHLDLDVRDEEGIGRLFRDLGRRIAVVVHAAAQPSHDWAAREPVTDFTVNANGTLVMLEATRRHCPEAPFLFPSTNKVYGDRPNGLPLVELETRFEVDPSHPYHAHGIDEEMSVDQCLHSLFGVSKTAADLMVQEYGRYFGLRTGTFRCGCLTGAAHSGAQLHGFLSYLVKCAVSGAPYTIFGYKGKQVRDNVHAQDVAGAFWCFFERPRPGAVYNLGGSRHSHCSVLEAIELVAEIGGYRLAYTLSDQARAGDHVWWISDVRRFRTDYPEWGFRFDLRTMLAEMVEAAERHRREAPELRA